jgi:serine/threonine protein kinase
MHIVYRVGKECSAAAASLYQACLQHDPKLRPSASEIVTTLEKNMIWTGPSPGAVRQTSDTADTQSNMPRHRRDTDRSMDSTPSLGASWETIGASTVLDLLTENHTHSDTGEQTSELWTRGVSPADVDIQSDASGQPAVLGRGAYAVVYLGRWGATQVAVKVMRESDAGAEREVRAEADILIALRHPNVVLLMAVCISPGRPVKRQLLHPVPIPL